MSRPKSQWTKQRELEERPRCPRCKSRRSSVKDYPDATLRVCHSCRYPVRTEKP